MILSNKKLFYRDSPGSSTRSKWDSPRTFVPEASTCCTPPISVSATNLNKQTMNVINLTGIDYENYILERKWKNLDEMFIITDYEFHK